MIIIDNEPELTYYQWNIWRGKTICALIINVTATHSTTYIYSAAPFSLSLRSFYYIDVVTITTCVGQHTFAQSDPAPLICSTIFHLMYSSVYSVKLYTASLHLVSLTVLSIIFSLRHSNLPSILVRSLILFSLSISHDSSLEVSLFTPLSLVLKQTGHWIPTNGMKINSKRYTYNEWMKSSSPLSE